VSRQYGRLPSAEAVAGVFGFGMVLAGLAVGLELLRMAPQEQPARRRRR